MRFAIASALLFACARGPAPMPPPHTFAAPPDTVAAKPVARDLPKPVEEPTERHRYLEWVILADAVTAPLAFTWFVRSDVGRSVLWGVPVMVATPSVHLAAGNTTMAAISFPTRVAAYSTMYYLTLRYREEHLRLPPLGTLLVAELAVGLTTTLDILFAYIDRVVPAYRKLPLVPAVTPLTGGAAVTWSITL